MFKATPNVWNLDLLAPATTQIVVVTDTHFVLPDNGQSEEWAAVREFPVRTTRALQLAAALPRDAAVHLGDISHEYPETGRAEIAQQGALDQFSSLGLEFFQAAGNMDIGDKPDPTSPAQWVTAETLAGWHERCGHSWRSFEAGEFHGVVLNTQIMNGPLPEAQAQRIWAEHDLASHSGRPTLLFLHMPIYYVDRHEHSFGFYNSLDEPARSWLLGLIGKYGIEHVFTGHTHTVEINRHGLARLWTGPSTATSRAGLAEAYAIVGPDRGRGDIDKLGFYFVRKSEHGMSVHLVRTGRDTPALNPEDPRRQVLTRTSRDLPYGRIGVYATHPLGHANPGPVIWPSIVRQPVRDDFRLMSIMELGARFVRVPASDLSTPSEASRLELLRDEQVAIEPYWLWSDRHDLVAETAPFAEAIDSVEAVLAGEMTPPVALLDQLATLRQRGMPVKLTTAMVNDTSGGHYHPRTRVGFRVDELPSLDEYLRNFGATIDRVACRLDPHQPIGDQVQFSAANPLTSIGGIDWYLDFDDLDDMTNARLAAEAVVSIAVHPNSRLVLGPLVDMDRSMDTARGLIDRLSNPTPAFNVVKLLNSLLFRDSGTLHAEQELGVTWMCSDDWRLSLIQETGNAVSQLATSSFALSKNIELFDLTHGLSWTVTTPHELETALRTVNGLAALVTRQSIT